VPPSRLRAWTRSYSHRKELRAGASELEIDVLTQRETRVREEAPRNSFFPRFLVPVFALPSFFNFEFRETRNRTVNFDARGQLCEKGREEGERAVEGSACQVF
jgi:hypothetical protein